MADNTQRLRPSAEERDVVWDWRFEQATEAGLTHAQAVLFADGDGDVGLLRRLALAGVDRRLIARICR